MYQRLLTKVALQRLWLQLDGVDGFLHAGRAAMWIDGVGWAPRWKTGGLAHRWQVGYTMVPAGPKGQYSATYGDGSASRRRARTRSRLSALQWAVSKAQGSRLLQAAACVPQLDLNDAEVRKA